jgi:hypothetical protein
MAVEQAYGILGNHIAMLFLHGKQQSPVHILGNKSAGTAIAGKTGKAGTQDKCQKHDCATLLLSHILFM